MSYGFEHSTIGYHKACSRRSGYGHLYFQYPRLPCSFCIAKHIFFNLPDGKYASLFEEFHECGVIYKDFLNLYLYILIQVELYQIKSVESSSLSIVSPSILF